VVGGRSKKTKIPLRGDLTFETFVWSSRDLFKLIVEWQSKERNSNENFVRNKGRSKVAGNQDNTIKVIESSSSGRIMHSQVSDLPMQLLTLVRMLLTGMKEKRFPEKKWKCFSCWSWCCRSVTMTVARSLCVCGGGIVGRNSLAVKFSNRRGHQKIKMTVCGRLTDPVTATCHVEPSMRSRRLLLHTIILAHFQ
jgi:hypothetical protein